VVVLTSENDFSKENGGNYSPKVIFSYSLNHLQQSKKVSFFYELKGRYNQPGILKRCNVLQLAKGALVVPEERAGEVEAFLKKWGCSYSKYGAMVTA
jgi:hypothetical protein